MTTTQAVPAPATITQRLIDLARTRAGRTALIDASGARGRSRQVLTYPGLAATLQHAAAGLAWHGLRRGDVVGVLVDDAASFALAVHAIRAAGGVASPVAGGTGPASMAAQLRDCGARMLITSPRLAVTALAAADRSWVRQVITLGEAPGAIPFSSLLCRGTAEAAGAGAGELALLPYAEMPAGRGSSGGLGPVAFTNADLMGELARLTVTGLTEHDVVIAVPPAGDGRAYTVLLDLALIRGTTVVAAGIPGVAEVARAHGGTAAIVPWEEGLPGGLALRPLTVTAAEDDSHTVC